jgi:hypothetical protein
MRSSPRAAFLPPFIAILVLSTVAAFAAPPASAPRAPKPPKVHTAVLGSPRRVTWLSASSISTPPPASNDTDTAAPPPAKNLPAHLALTIRPLLIDGRRKEWTTGAAHEITDHTFAVLQALNINDALPTDKSPHFIWQTGAWLLIDRSTGHITPLKIPAYDSSLTGISWYRDLAAYCSVSPAGKTLSAEVFLIGSRKAAARKRVSAWPLPELPPLAAPSEAPAPNPLAPAVRPRPAVPSLAALKLRQETGLPHPALCTTFEWQRDPLRVVITPRSDLPSVTLDIAPGSAPSPSKRSRDSDTDAAAPESDAPESAPAPEPPPAAAPASPSPEQSHS